MASSTLDFSRSILLTKISRLRFDSLALLHNCSVSTLSPADGLSRNTAPPKARMHWIVSAKKVEYPGVSMRYIWDFFHASE